jgi:tRNA (pseudouridine54-N1)-methyltransferase
MHYGQLLNEAIEVRRFAIVGHRAMSKGKLPLNDLAGGAGRMDVLIRAVMSSLLTSHGLRDNVEVVLHLQGGPGPHRRLKFVGSELRGFHAEERSVAGLIAKVIREPLPAIGHWIERTPGLYDGGGSLSHTLMEWKDSVTVRLDADAERLWNENSTIPMQSTPTEDSIAFLLSDDQPLDTDQGIPRSLGSTWLQGHHAIAICNFLLDEGVELNL